MPKRRVWRRWLGDPRDPKWWFAWAGVLMAGLVALHLLDAYREVSDQLQVRSVWFDELPQDVEPDHRAAVEAVLPAAAHYWSLAPAASREDADVVVTFVHEFRGPRLGINYGTAVTVELGDSDSTCLRWLAYDSATVYRIVAHELGHALGHEHVEEEGHVMSAAFAVNYADAVGCEPLASYWTH